MNIEFQAESPRIHVLLPTILAHYKSTLFNFIQKEYLNKNVNINEIDITNSKLYKPIIDVYIGAKAEIFIKNSNLKQEDIKEITQHCLGYYIELCKQIQKRFKFDDDVLIAIQALNPSNLAENINSLIVLFPNILVEEEIEDIDHEWRNLICNGINLIEDSYQQDLEKFWSKIFTLKNGIGEKMFPKLEKFIYSLLCLPHSSAAAERVFSALNLIKNKVRNSLLVETVSAIMASKEMLFNNNVEAEAHSWEPSTELIKTYVKKY